MGLKFSCLKDLKTCVSSRTGAEGTSPVSSALRPPRGDNHLHVPSIIVTPPTPTGGTALSRQEEGIAPPR